MSTPIKPWEQQRSTLQQQLNQQQILNSSSPMQMIQTPVGRIRSSGGLPQLPPRPGGVGVSSYGTSPYSYMGLGMGGSYPGRYNSYSSYGSYGGMGGYGNYGMGGFGGMYGGGSYYGNGYGMNPESRFIQLAEESTRPAFQGIESLVRAFGSISMMLDSTFFAVTSSFRAVLGVAENFGQIRSMFGQIWSSFALLRFINWMYRRILRLFGFKVVEDLGKEAWNQAINETNLPPSINNSNVSSWPIFMFLGMIVSAPYFISRLLPPIIDKSNPKNWPEPGRKAIAQYPFQASNAQELTLRPGDQILIAPKSIQDEMQLSGTGWILAASNANANSFGLVPINYIQLVGGTVRQKLNPTKLIPNTHNLQLNQNLSNTNVNNGSDPSYADITSIDPYTGSIETNENDKLNVKDCAQKSVPGSSQTNSELPK